MRLCYCSEDGETYGNTVFISDEEHPTLLGPDGEKLRISRRKPVGFDLRHKRTDQARAGQ